MPEIFESESIEVQSVAAASDAAFDAFLDRLMQAESNGRDLAANPRSTALGPFQFIKATFLELARRHFAVETGELDDEQLLDLRVDRAFARRAAAAYCRDNLAFMSGQGLTPTFGHLRLAFLVGPTAAVRLTRAIPQTPAADVLGASVMKANPFMNDMSASDLIARAAWDVSADRSNLVTPAPRPRTRVVASRPEAKVSPRPRAGGAGAPPRPDNAAVAATCNRRLASCRRWIAMQANKQRVDRQKAQAREKEASRSSPAGKSGRSGV